MTSNFSFIIVSFSLGFADLVQPLMEKSQYPNNKFQINFNDQISKGSEVMQRVFVWPLKK